MCSFHIVSAAKRELRAHFLERIGRYISFQNAALDSYLLELSAALAQLLVPVLHTVAAPNQSDIVNGRDCQLVLPFSPPRMSPDVHNAFP
jgi:hypothetical protein